LHAGLQRALFADQRAPSLEVQASEVLRNPRELDLPVEEAAARLRRDSTLVREFAAAVGMRPDSAVTGRTVQLALAAFIRSLGGLGSRFDRATAGDTAALAAERRGFNLFMGKAACGTCHFAPLFGGSLPPAYAISEPEVIGVPATPATRRATIDPDLGVYAIDHVPQHRHAFKTPNLRNVAVTAPYMHNGVYRTLEEVVDFYDRGGGVGLGIALPHQTLSSEPLHLSHGEKADLVAFLRSLTDSAYEVPVSKSARTAAR
jgi:cytochrome c peroxidase